MPHFSILTVSPHSMVRHLSYFELLATMEEDSSSWAPTLAGLGVLGLIDAAREDASVIDADWTGVRAVAERVASIREGSPVRRPLTRIVDHLRGELDWPAVNGSLFAYGRALDLDGSWSLAADVFGTVADIARAEHEPELAIEATTALGGAARRSGDWDRSAEGYAVAAHLADTLGDKASGLTVRVGTANTQIARGNLPAAQMILDEVIDQAGKSGLDGVEALAYHASAAVAHLKGRFADTVSMAYKALEKTTNPVVKDTIMADIAAAFVELGMRDSARDAHLVISMTSRYQWVRWQASINLMELAAMDGMEEAFDGYARDLKNAALDPRLRSYFLLYYGQGCLSFGRDEQGRSSIAEAKEFATRNKIHQVAFDADKALAAAQAGERKARTAMPANSWTDPIPSDVEHVALALSHLRDATLSSPPADNWM
ncbi:MAG: hypothetical protein ABI681_06340 [Gemmatimonadales bacterium]